MVTRVPTDQQDVEYSEYQPMIKIPTDVQNTNRHYPPEKKCLKYRKEAFKIPTDNFKIPKKYQFLVL